MKMKVISIHRRLIKPSFLTKFAIPSQEHGYIINAEFTASTSSVLLLTLENA